MWREQAAKRNRVILLLLVGGAGYLLGSWHARPEEPGAALSAAQTVALRFPERQYAAPVAPAALPAPASVNAPTATPAMVLGATQLALLNPQPMVPIQPGPVATDGAPEAAETAAPEAAAVLASADPELPQRPAPEASRRTAEPRSAEATRHANRPGFVLNDAQIASIKGRLHLTPDQESLWPAVEAALRNIAYANARDARRRGGHAAAAALAALDPNSAAVQDLKSAAVPLIMSFNDEQKNEVRSLAHVMGLDKLASEF